MKHLLYQHQNNVEALRINAEVAVKEVMDGCKAQYSALTDDKALLKKRLREQVRHKHQLLCLLCRRHVLGADPIAEGRSYSRNISYYITLKLNVRE